MDERNVIRFLLNKFNFELNISEAANGKEALAHLEKTPTDILFTDVKMPFMNGIELAAKVRELYPNTQIIFFSGYNDFEYVKEALSLKAVNYILKPVNPSEFKKTISSVLQNINEHKKEQTQKEANTIYLKNHILYRLINKTSFDTLKAEYPSMDLTFLNDYSRLILIQFENTFFDTLLLDEDMLPFHQQISEVIQCPFDFINLNPSQSLLLFHHEDHSSKYYMALGVKIQKQILSCYDVNCYISISTKISNPNDISQAYEEAESYLENRFFYSDTYIHSVDTSYITHDNNPEQDHHILQAIEKDIKFKDTYSLKQNMNILFEKYQKEHTLSHIYMRYLCSSILEILYQELPEYSESSLNQDMEAIYFSHHFSEIRDLLNNVLKRLIQKLEKAQQSPKHAIQLVQQYIYEHYGEELSLNILAEKVFLTPRYLSSIFIQEIGCGINKYIKNFRMEKAKELLLNTNMKVNEICRTVGYSNVSYFCQSFREDFCLTPEKYRQMHH